MEAPVEGMTSVSNFARQQEEVETLREIYTSDDDDFQAESINGKYYKLSITINNVATFHIILPETYPDGQELPQFSFKPWPGSSSQLETLGQELGELCFPGEVVVFQWVEHVRTFLVENIKSQVDYEPKLSDSDSLLPSDIQSQLESLSHAQESISHGAQRQPRSSCSNKHEGIEIKHGDPVTFKRSTFQAHIARVKSVEEASSVYNELLKDSKLAKATHNIMAYRIAGTGNGNFISDNDDDGETAAGSRLAHLLEIIGARDVIVVVTRWYGGILLGPKRFKYINNVARDMLAKHGYID